jgi:hypothetical protein
LPVCGERTIFEALVAIVLKLSIASPRITPAIIVGSFWIFAKQRKSKKIVNQIFSKKRNLNYGTQAAF